MQKELNHTLKLLRQRRHMLVLPLLVLPFATLLFWMLGGGAGSTAGLDAPGAKGLNQALPEAQLAADLSPGKESHYEQAAADSARRRELLKRDAYAFGQRLPAYFEGEGGWRTTRDSLAFDPSFQYSFGAPRGGGEEQLAARQASVYRKLEQLQEVLRDEPQPREAPVPRPVAVAPGNTLPGMGPGLAQLEQRMLQAAGGSGEDAELHQLNGMLEKILDIQHPQRVREKIRQVSEDRRGAVFPVAPSIKTVPVSLLENSGGASEGALTADTASGFHTIEEIASMPIVQGMIPAVVHETQTLVSGATVKLRLTEELFINGMLLPRDSFVFGTASLQGERLKITIQGVRFRQALFPVALAVYDLDGMEGIHIPGGITREAARQAADRAARDIGLSSLHPSLEVQAMNTGLEAARSLLGRKTRQVKATVKAGYQVLLRDEKQS